MASTPPHTSRWFSLPYLQLAIPLALHLSKTSHGSSDSTLVPTHRSLVAPGQMPPRRVVFPVPVRLASPRQQPGPGSGASEERRAPQDEGAGVERVWTERCGTLGVDVSLCRASKGAGACACVRVRRDVKVWNKCERLPPPHLHPGPQPHARPPRGGVGVPPQRRRQAQQSRQCHRHGESGSGVWALDWI